ncbi:MAG: GT4 family glycosyltransferase PelF [Actinomyces bowdenii]|nr:GT4 family glycosyltransferase PelF [Actinomyces bowdenii]
MSSSIRKRLESLPSYYSAPAGGYAPMPPSMSNRGSAASPQAARRRSASSAEPAQAEQAAERRPSAPPPPAPARPGQEGAGPTRPAPGQSAPDQPGAGRPASAGESPVPPGLQPTPQGYGFVATGPSPASPPDADPAARQASAPPVPSTPVVPTPVVPPAGAGPQEPGPAPQPSVPYPPAPHPYEAHTPEPAGPLLDDVVEPEGVLLTEDLPAVSPSEELPLPVQEAATGPGSPSWPDGVPADGVYQDVDVAIVMESTYPYLKGGVSAVVHDIITGNPELTFGIIHLTWDSQAPNKDLYGMPDNVAWVRVLYLAMEEHEEAFLRARPRDLRMGRRKRRELSRRLVGSLLALAQEGRTEPLWDLITEGLAGGTRRYPVWAILGTQEFMEAYREMMPDLGMSMSDIFWCLRDFFSLAYAVLSEPMPRAAVYHAHTTGYAALLSVAASRLHGTGFLLTEHNLYVRDTVNTLLDRRLDRNITLNDYRTFDVTGRQRMWMAWWLEMGRLCYPYAYASTYLYPRAITEATELGGDASKAIIIPNGIVTTEFDASYAARMRALEAIRREGAGRHLWKLVYIARVVPIKGLMDMIDSMKLMVDRGLNVHLDVCGPTEHRPDYFEKCLNHIIEQGLESVITIRGTVKVRALLPEFDLFVLPSYNEGLPVVSLETMGAGIPTVSTDVGAVRSVVEDEIVAEDGTVWGPCGTIIEPGDPVVMADGVQRIIEDLDLYEQLCRAARGRVEAAYNLEKVNAAYNKVYRQGGAGKGA